MENVLSVRNEYRVQFWANAIRECRESGLSNREFCIQNGISVNSYYYWLRKLRSNVGETAAPQLVKLENTASAGELEIRFRGAELKLPAAVDINAVAAILRSVQSL